MSFQLPLTMSKEKVFLVKRSELEGRLDPFCYIPSLVFLDNLIKSKTDNRLKDFAVGYSSGATPSKDESDIHYTSKEKGFPFVRVQNLSTTGELNFDNMKYISKETHNGLLNRSKVFAGDLLVKITGVGRMAVASVTPECFEGNINQHIVVIRTESVAISRNLAAFINLDCIEKLASKRATGGTRPALDYPALFSLPVISDERFSVKMAVASAASKQKEAQAQQLLDSIDTYLMNELGIELPTVDESSISQRIFVRKFSEASGGRFDAEYFKEEYVRHEKAICEGTFKPRRLADFITAIAYGASVNNEYEAAGIPLLRIKDLQPNEINSEKTVFLPESMRKEIGNAFVKCGDFLISRSGSLGVTAIVDEAHDGFAFGSFMIKFDITENEVTKFFISYILNSCLGKTYFKRNKIGAIQGNITIPVIKSCPIPLPPLEKQNEIVAHIQTIRAQAKRLRAEAAAGLEQAKREVEAMIIGQH